MSDTKTYLIKLTPIDKYFFGGETTFGAAGNSNYLVKSNYFPQQTGLLGMLRYELLLQNDLLNPGSGRKLDDKAIELIGEKSFRVKEGNKFGLIQSLSTTYVVNEKGDFLIPNPYFIFNGGKCTNFEIEFSENGTEIVPSIFQSDDDGERVKDEKTGFDCYYKDKDGLFNGFVSLGVKLKYQYEPEKNDFDDFIFDENHKDFKEYIFYPEEQIGIHKEGDDESFYKQTFMRMRPDFSLAFIVKMDANDKFKFESNTIFMGGEKSAFRMEVEEFNDSLKFGLKPKITNNTQSKIRTILLESHSYIEPDIYDDCVFAITKTMDFRFLVSSVKETEHYYSLDRKSNDKKQLFKSEKRNLVKSGSLFFVKEENFDKVKNKIENKIFHQIGYNHYTEI